ncbi:MAG: TolC family protein [Nitrospirae bacterium]|nr:TolC family protein [Nitrospirota bacterium]
MGFFLVMAGQAEGLPHVSPVPGPLELTPSQAVALALSQSREIWQARERLAAAEAAYEVELARYTPKAFLEFSASRAHQESPLNGGTSLNGTLPPTPLSIETSQGGMSVSSTSFLGRSGWKQETIISEAWGGRLTWGANLVLERVRETETVVPVGTTYRVAPEIGLSYKQPLTPLGIQAEAAPLRIARLNREQARLTYEKAEDTLIAETVGSYLQLLKAVKLQVIAAESLKVSEEQLRVARAQVRLGRLAEIEAMKMDLQYRRDQNSLIEAEVRVRNTQRLLAERIGLAIETPLIPRMTLSHRPLALDRDRLMAHAMQHRLELRDVALAKKVAEVSVATAASPLEPFLTVNGAYRRVGQGGSPSESLTQFRDTPEAQWAVSAVFTIPLTDGGLTPALVTKSRAALRETGFRREAVERQTVREIQEGIAELDGIDRRYQILTQGLEVAEQVFRIDQLRFARGLLSSTDFQRSQLSLFQVRTEQFTVLIDYRLAALRLLRAAGYRMNQALSQLPME